MNNPFFKELPHDKTEYYPRTKKGMQNFVKMVEEKTGKKLVFKMPFIKSKSIGK